MTITNTSLILPSKAEEVFLTVSDTQAQSLSYSKVIAQAQAGFTAASDTQEARVLPYRNETQFSNGEAIGGLGFQLINMMHRCSQDPNRIIITHDCALPAVSTDNGDTFTRLGGATRGTGLFLDRPQAIISSVENDNVLVAFGSSYYDTNTSFASFLPGFFRSTDGGNSWTQVYNHPKIMQEQTYDGFTEFGYARGLENVLANDPSNANFWCCGTEYASPPSDFNAIDPAFRDFFRSLDGGLTWTKQTLSSGDLNGNSFNWWHALVVHPSDSSVWACTDDGLYKSTNAFSAPVGSVTFSKVIVDAIDPEISDIVWVDNLTAYACGRTYSTSPMVGQTYPGTSYGNEYFAIWKTTDGGSTWTVWLECHRTVTSENNLSGSFIETSTFSADVGATQNDKFVAPWKLKLCPGNNDLYIVGGPNTWTWKVFLVKDIAAVSWSTTSSDYITNLSGNARFTVLPGPQAANKFEAFAGFGGHGNGFKALTAAELTTAGYDPVADLGYIFGEVLSGWKGENIYSFLRPAFNSDIWMYGNADVNMYATFNDGNYVQARTLDAPLTRGGVNRVTSMIYSQPSIGRVVTSMGGAVNAHLNYYNDFTSDAFSAALSVCPGMTQDAFDTLSAEQQTLYAQRFPNEMPGTGVYGNRQHKAILQNPDNVKYLATADLWSDDGGETWQYIPGLERDSATMNSGDLTSEVIRIHPSLDGRHVVWAVSSTAPTTTRSSLLRATWSVSEGWSSWEILPNVHGLIDDPSLPVSSRMNMSTIVNCVVTAHPTNKNIVYAAVVEGSSYNLAVGEGHLWKFNYLQKNDTTSPLGQGLGGWTKISAALDTAHSLGFVAAAASQNINHWISTILVDYNEGVSTTDDILYLTFGTPGTIALLRSIDGGSTWSQVGQDIPCSSDIRAFLVEDTGEIITSACDGCYVFPAPLGYLRNSSITTLWSKSVVSPSGDVVP